MDFYKIKEREAGTAKKPTLDIYPDFNVVRSKDLMVRGKSFYAVWDEERGLWSDDEFDVQRLVDEDLRKYVSKLQDDKVEVHRKFLGSFSSSSWLQFRNYMGHLSDNYTRLDENLTFANTKVTKTDYVSKRLPYDLVEGDISAWDEVVGTLYNPSERAKIEWAIGAIVAGDSKFIQKFVVFHGPGGTGKSTIMGIIEKMFDGYVAAFEAKALVGNNNAFATEVFKTNPLVAIQHDGDLSKIEDNSKLNSIISHEPMTMNEKFKPSYKDRVNAFLILGSNKPIHITDAKSGLIRRLIDIHPSGKLLTPRKYQALMGQIPFELGHIAKHCLDVYRSMGKDYYSGYKPVEMMLQTDVFFNFIEANYDVFKGQDGITLKQAYEMYKEFCEDSDIRYPLPQYKLREELKNYFEKFEDRAIIDDVRVRSYYSVFNADRFKTPTDKGPHMFSLVMDDDESIFDKAFSESLAQYATDEGTPLLYWDSEKRVNKNTGREFTPKPSQVVSTKLLEIDTSKEHFVKVPENHIIIDFDLTGSDGKKSAERNLEEASKWPSTYAEFSKSGAGIHLHYNYTEDPTELSAVYDDGIEIKVYTGNSTLRRKLTKCNNIPIADISSGLPLKEKKVMNSQQISDEKHLRALISKALRKEVQPGTKSNMDFINHVLEEAYISKMSYDVSDMKNAVFSFANGSTHQAPYCLKLVQTMHFKSEDVIEDALPDIPKDERLVIFDVEVFPNLFVVCWKYQGAPKSSTVVMVNPSPVEIEHLISMKLVGFNCRKYDNHILHAAALGYNNLQLYKLSKKIIGNVPNSTFGTAYSLSYTDIYDFSSKKQSLKKWEIELGINHMELGLPWDDPVDEALTPKVVEYCINDVDATDTVFVHLEADFIAREILSDLSGLSVNHTTQQHTSKIVFGADRNPQDKFVYTDLSDMFPGYEFDVYGRKSTYRDEITGEGGYVYSEPGMYENVTMLDITSMHPTSLEQLNMFGDYTKNFSDIKNARIAIKHKDYESAKSMLGGKLARHLSDPSKAKALSDALKIAINIVYGLTSASFDNSFKDPRNIDNIVAKRGALFMIDLKHEVQARGFQVVHIKTDSIKIPNATPEIIEFITEFGKKYGYDFEHEATYSKFCLVNDAVYIAKYADDYIPFGEPHGWTATGAQFQHPYVFKYLFSREPVVFDDMCEAKQVTTAMYLDFSDPDANFFDDTPMVFADMSTPETEGKYTKMSFVGKVGLFCPIIPGDGGGTLLRSKDDKFYAVTGTKGWKWMESDMVKTLGKESSIDGSYFEKMVNEAIETISKFGDSEWFRDA